MCVLIIFASIMSINYNFLLLLYMIRLSGWIRMNWILIMKIVLIFLNADLNETYMNKIERKLLYKIQIICIILLFRQNRCVCVFLKIITNTHIDRFTPPLPLPLPHSYIIFMTFIDFIDPSRQQLTATNIGDSSMWMQVSKVTVYCGKRSCRISAVNKR